MRGFENKTLDVLMKLLAVVATAMIAAVMLAGCGLVDEDTSACRPDGSNGSGSGSAIGFGVTAADSTTTTRTMTGAGLTATALTRTAEGTMTLDGSGGTESLRDKGFGVFACHTGVHPYVSTSTTANLMWNQPVAYNGTTGQWEYSPLVYWPNGLTGSEEYVTFFAYAPHSDHASDCIIDMSNPEETGDPWILYQLGGESQASGLTGWKARQVDLLYDFQKDQQRGQDVTKQVEFSFKHALASIGDKVTVSCDATVADRLKAVWTGSPVTMTVSNITVDYLLTRKGKLILNSSGIPNWQAVESEDAKVHRIVTFSPDIVMAEATSADNCTMADFESPAGQGVFYIPLEVGADKQQATVTADYVVTAGVPAYIVSEGTVSASVDLSFISNASENRDLSVKLKIPEIECAGYPMAYAEVGMIICSHGRLHAATTGELACGGKKVAVVAYVGDGTTPCDVSGYSGGLAIALQDAGQASWCGQAAAACLGSQTTSIAAALGFLNGLSATELLAGSAGHTHDAATMAALYQYDAGEAAGAHPAGTSRWFLPSVGQWNLMAKAMTGHDEGLSDSENVDYQAAAFNPHITAAGGTGMHGEPNMLYWSSTESSLSNAWYMSFEKGKTSKDDKTVGYCVRPVLAF